jgi:ribosomal protein S27E
MLMAPTGFILVAMTEQPSGHSLGLRCPECGQPWLRASTVPGRYRCVYCMHRYELRSVCPDCGEHSTIVRMSSTATTECNHCGASMLVRV